MIAIGCISQKGGVGKTTLARAIAVTYAQAGWQAKIADLDTGQSSATEWVTIRNRVGVEPVIEAQPMQSVAQAMRQRGYDLMVIDGRPYASAETLEIAKVSQLLVIPSNPTIDDLRPAVALAKELESRGIPPARFCFVLTMTLRSGAALEEARLFLQRFGYKLTENDLPARDGYRAAQNDGRSILETAYPALNQRAEAVMQEIVDRVSELTNSD